MYKFNIGQDVFMKRSGQRGRIVEVGVIGKDAVAYGVQWAEGYFPSGEYWVYEQWLDSENKEEVVTTTTEDGVETSEVEVSSEVQRYRESAIKLRAQANEFEILALRAEVQPLVDELITETQQFLALLHREPFNDEDRDHLWRRMLFARNTLNNAVDEARLKVRKAALGE